jgi:hypothetical protein
VTGFSGFLVAGDIHGRVEELKAALERAAARNLFFVSLGDVVDRGEDSAACLSLMRRAMEDGRAAWIRGNHDDKLLRAMLGNPVRPDIHAAKTMSQIDAADKAGAGLSRWLSAIWPEVPYYLRIRDTVLIHGGFDAAMLSLDPSPELGKKWPGRWYSLALYGETLRPVAQGEEPIRTYRWVDRVPKGMTVICGHDVVSTEAVLCRAGALGGRAIHLDTGAGYPGGRLSLLELHPDGRLTAASEALLSPVTAPD